jgi:hypothetical protein
MKMQTIGQLPVEQRAYSLPQFCRAYSIGRTLAYYEAKCGRLRLTRLGGRTLVLVEDAEAWANAARARSVPAAG